MGNEEDLYNRKRLHEVINDVHGAKALSQINHKQIEKLDNEIKAEIRSIDVELKQMVNLTQNLSLRLSQLEVQLKTYNRFMWALTSSAIIAILAWFFK